MSLVSSLVRSALVLLLALAGASCGAARYHLDDAELARFEAAGPVLPEIDQKAILDSLPTPGPYRVVRGDLLEIRAPRVFFEETYQQATTASGPVKHSVRVDNEGKIQLPLVDEQEVVGLALAEIETLIVEAAHPKFLTRRPAIVVQVEDYHRAAVSVMGAVETPGLHYLRSDQLSLFGALSEAGGILKSTNLVVGARRIRITRPGGEEALSPVVLPVKGLNIPVSDVRLAGGERIEVERYEPDTFTVVGLVEGPGAYEYPPEVIYNLMQAIATAGGVDRIADPPYATIFRKDASGQILAATFEIKGNGLVSASTLEIKPGDVIAIEHTAVSWTRSFAASVLRINFGWFADLNE